MKNFTPCLWFDTQAEEAAKFYTSVFKNSKITGITHYDEESSKPSGMPVGTVLTVSFEINGQKFLGLNGGPMFKLSEAISFIIPCDTQEELDDYWAKLTADGGEESYCGWLKDKFGLSWQVGPAKIEEWMNDPDRTKAARVMKAVLGMRKLNIAELEAAYEGVGEAAQK
jgi:predicted 3-demethylubiquinone-9 3-methyltransferase (glyoxalase superfamily)